MTESSVAGKFDLDPGNHDSGAFTFEDMELLAQNPPATPLQQLINLVTPSTVSSTIGHVDADATLLDDDKIQLQCDTSVLGPEHGRESPSTTEDVARRPRDQSLPLKEGISVKETSKKSASASEATPRPAALSIAQDLSGPRPYSFSSGHTNTTKPQSTTQRTESTARRLHRPTELNLGNSIPDASKPQSELEKRFHLMRDSKTQLKAALRSPTQLLQERLNMSPKKSKHEEKVHAFVPPQPSRNGCLLPGPAGQIEAFTSTSVRARTEAGGRPAWWCKSDRLVVFDGIDIQEDGEMKIHTRTSKGLSIARRRGDTEMIVIPMDCEHCQEMLNRHEWKYDIQVCKRSVCWDCKERCKWEREQEIKQQGETRSRMGGNRDRADSMLQDVEIEEEDLMRKMGIEQERTKSPMEAVGGIEERMGV